MHLHQRLLLSLLLVLGLTSLASANLKTLVLVGPLFYGNTSKLPEYPGTEVCAYVTADPCCLPTRDVRTFTVCGNRTSLVGGNNSICTALAGIIVTKLLAEYEPDYPGLTLTAANLSMQGCPL